MIRTTLCFRVAGPLASGKSGSDPREAEALCLETAREFPLVTFFTGKLIVQRERWWQRFLHNETATAIQKRLQWAGKTMVTLPIRVRESAQASTIGG